VLTDPSHLPFAHHNIISNRNQAAFIDIQVANMSKQGFDSEDFFPKKPSSGRRPLNMPTGAPAAPTAPAVTVPQSLHFRPPNLLFQVINVTQVPCLPCRALLCRAPHRLARMHARCVRP
jgi:phenylpropionate dioxygenase-like ring-hydroxylating dioxygenase large terminal subunit